MSDSSSRADPLAAARLAKERRKKQRAARTEQGRAGLAARAAALTEEVPIPTKEQQTAQTQIEQELREQRRARDRRPPAVFAFGDNSVDDNEEAEYKEVTGSRLVDMDLFNEHITRWLPCPACQSHSLFCRPEDEYRAGLGGKIRFWCHSCKAVTHSLPLSPQLPRKESATGPGIAEVNARLVLRAAQIGTGETHMAQLFGTLNVPVVRGTTWANAEDLVTAATQEAASESRAAAVEAEKLAAYDRGTPVEADGKVPISGEYDMCWAKRSSGRAYNSLEGSGSFLGACTGKVLVSRVMKKACDKCNKGICDGLRGCNRNYSGSSGGMESTAGGNMILELAQDANEHGIRLATYVTDLDAKTSAAVREKSQEAEIPQEKLPGQKYDPGHWKKGFGKDLADIKKRTGITNILGVDDQAVTRDRLSQAISQHRECGSVDHFTAALWNVFDHIFGRHARCCQFFKCPAARVGSAHVPPFKLKQWLPTAGSLEDLMRAAFVKLTERKMVLGLMNCVSTQRVESLNHVRATIRRKDQHHAASNKADMLHDLGDLRWNHQRLASTEAVLRKLRVQAVGSHGEHALSYLDHESRGDSQRKSTLAGKRRRKANRRKRSGETNTVEDGAYAPQSERGLAEVPLPTGVDASVYSGTLDATMVLPTRALIVPWDLEHTGAQGGESVRNQDVFEFGAVMLQWDGGRLTRVAGNEFSSFVRHSKPMTKWVRENIAEAGPAERQATSERLVQAPPLCEVITKWFAAVKAAKKSPMDPVILAAHNGHSVDWTVTYWAMVRAGMDAHAVLSDLGVVGVLDTLKLAKMLPESEVSKLAKTPQGLPSFTNKSLTAALTNESVDRLVWHRALDDARATGAVMHSQPMQKLLANPAHLENAKALITRDQLVAAVHHAHNEQVQIATGTAAPAGRKRRAGTCSYCQGRELPPHASRRTCPKRARDEAAQAAAGPSEHTRDVESE